MALTLLEPTMNYISFTISLEKIKTTSFGNSVKMEQLGILYHLNLRTLVEAGVKSTKYHLKRVIGITLLTYEEFYTVLTQIESCLNSRLLYPMSNDPNDLTPLTPAHFIIGSSLTAIVDQNYLDVKENLLSRFQRLQKMLQHFWTRWSKEYISELQVRTKWKQNMPQLLKPGTLVIVKEDNMPPLRWQLGRIEQIHPGDDGVVRAVTVKTSSGSYKRAANKMCVLPNQEH